MGSLRFPAHTCSSTGVCNADGAMPCTSCCPSERKTVQGWQGFSLTIKSRNFVRTDFRRGTGRLLSVPKLHYASQPVDNSDCIGIFVRKISSGP